MNQAKELPKGTKIGKYRIEFLIGAGGFGHVYKVKDTSTNQSLALKTEQKGLEHSFIKNEIESLTNLKTPCFPIIRDKGEYKNLYFYVMNIYGLSISDIIKMNKLPLSTSLIICCQMFQVIETLHSLGYIHRDIKPSNFLLQQSTKDPLVLVDFGLAILLIDPNTGKPKPLNEGRFVGTKKYASTFSHSGEALGQRDDLISWIYSCVEIIDGSLPWASCETIEDLVQVKHDITPKELCRNLPREFHKILTYLLETENDQRPPYKKIQRRLDDALEANNIDIEKFNWQQFYISHADLEGKCANAQKQRQSNHQQKEGKGCEIA
ncbi:CK1 family protein kinase [Tritrichomonas foetus]|uniref:non-specific serine/threonine protein kinase n=1 Tax=Tritrichomonas foetus TaxID=1144522 RepID=A0A1J4J6V1_9EUKA|nr:CK1 family protein kinase [Tritrichomonas foetus]|eukprot:OHS94962.1 CK1 family protein kinase [Tritrichomonas foetus]